MKNRTVNKTNAVNSKNEFTDMPIENHKTAAWANIKSTKPVSEVPVPDETEVMNAKEYVDTNEK